MGVRGVPDGRLALPATVLAAALLPACGSPDAPERARADPGARSAGRAPVSAARRGAGPARAGARLVRELGCGACHAGLPDPGPARSRAPAFGDEGRPYRPGFLLSYLQDPERGRAATPGPRMPDFHLSEAESLALSLFILRRSGRAGSADSAFRRARRDHPRADADLGRRIFRALNCAGCHAGTRAQPWTAGPALDAERLRARPRWLRQWLEEPYALRPYGFHPGTGSRMPDFRLSESAADAVARHLLRRTSGERDSLPDADPPALSAYERRKSETLIRDRHSCLGCHRLGGDGGRIGPALDGVAARRTDAYLRRIVSHPDSAAPGSVMPRVPMTRDRRRLLVGFLAGLDRRRGTGANGPNPPASGRSGYLSLVDHPLRPPTEAERGRGGRRTRGARLYRSRCASCHGAGGEGDGYNARYLPTAPAEHASAGEMSARSDDVLFDGVWAGGRVLDRSHRMPPFGGSLTRAQIRSVVDYVRELCDCRGPAWSRRTTETAPGGTETTPAPAGLAADTGRADAPGSDFSLYGRDGPSTRPSDYVGAEACGECHRAAYREWAGSTHGEAGGTPSPRTVIAPFGSDTIRFRDATVLPVVNDTGAYEFRVRWDGHGTRSLTVDGVVGRGHLAGGGNQGFFTRAGDGTYRFLPFDWSRTEGTWFCSTVGRRGRGWVPAADLELADCTDWPPRRVLGNVRRYEDCQECHASQVRVEVERGQPHLATRYRSLRINCESCHGPGRRHVRLARSGRLPGRAELGLPALDTLDEHASVGVCLRCHALKTPLRGGYRAGEPLEEHYALRLPVLGGRPHLPDGRVRTFAYQGTHLSSQCFLSGSMRCTDCHSPHDQSYRDHVGRPVEGPYGNGQCTSCHPSVSGPALASHTHHPASSEGSRCVRCHMPYLQQPRVGSHVRYARSDHSVPVPRPAFDDSLGLRSACAGCHDDRSTASLQRTAERWWGPIKPQDPLVRGILAAEAAEDPARAGELLLRPDRHDPIAQLGALRRMLDGHLAPDMDSVPGGVRDRLERLARSADAAIRASALAALHYATGRRPPSAEEGEVAGRVKDRWAVVLGFLGDRHRRAGETAAAIATYRKAVRVRPDDADLHFALGRAHAAAGNGRSAVEHYRRTLELEPRRALAHVNLGAVHAARGRPNRAAEAYRAALEVNPLEPLAHFRLGNLHLRAGRPSRAAGAYRRALAADPGLAGAYFAHGRALVRLGRSRAALDTVQVGLEFRPRHGVGRRMLRDLRRSVRDSGLRATDAPDRDATGTPEIRR